MVRYQTRLDISEHFEVTVDPINTLTLACGRHFDNRQLNFAVKVKDIEDEKITCPVSPADGVIEGRPPERVRLVRRGSQRREVLHDGEVAPAGGRRQGGQPWDGGRREVGALQSRASSCKTPRKKFIQTSQYSH